MRCTLLGPGIMAPIARINPTYSIGLSGVLCFHKRIRNLLATVGGRNEHEQRAASDDEAEGAGGCVSFVIWRRNLASSPDVFLGQTGAYPHLS